MGFSGPPEGNPICPNLIEIKEETVEGLGGFEPPTCGLGNRCSNPAELQPLVGIIPLFFLLDNAFQLHFR